MSGIGPGVPDDPGITAAPRADVGDAAAESTPIAGFTPKADRWAHRRGEPRLFVLLWTTYLFAGTLLALAGVSAAGVLTGDMYRPAARLLMATVIVGVAVFWPMVRLSQEPPRTPRAALGACVQDYLIVILPAQAVIWPQWSLASLPIGVVAVLAANIGAWALIAGGLLAHALPRAAARRFTPAGRAAWMGAFVLVALAGAAGALAEFAGAPRAGAGEARAAWMLSPVTAVLEIMAERTWSGRAGAVTGMHWAMTGLTAACGVAVWGAAWWRWGRAGGDAPRVAG